MTAIANGTIAFDADELAWFIAQYGQTEWAVYTAGIDEVVTHTKQGPGEDLAGDPFTEESVREYLTELNRRFGPGSPMDLGHPLYAVALHWGMPAFGSHEHSYPVQPPHGSLAHPGNCECGSPYSEVEEKLAADMAAVEWAVYVVGPNAHLVAQGQDIDDFEPSGPPFTEQTARGHAAAINAAVAEMEAQDPSPFNPVVRAVVLHYGEPDTSAGA